MTGKHFFRFPKNDEKRRKLWKKFAQKPTKATAVICEDHFETKFLIQKDRKIKLTNDAVPTMFYKKTEEGFEVEVNVGFDGEDYFGDEADEMTKAIAKAEHQEIIAIETAFVNEQVKLDELKSRCRLCAEIKDELTDISSFSTYNVSLNDFLQCLGLRISDSEFFTNSVCEECFTQVLLIDTFMIKCKAADQLLWDEVGRLKTFTAVIDSPMKSLDSSQEITLEENVVVFQTEIYNESNITKNQAENISGTFTNVIEEGEMNSNEKRQMFSVSYVTSDISELEGPSKPFNNRKSGRNKANVLPQPAIMDPNCNKFAMKTYNCEVCLKVFAGLKTYKSHVCDVLEIRCPECGDKFETVFLLKSHRRHLHSRNKEKNYCPICQTVITGRSTAFKKHKSKCNRSRSEKIQCQFCPKVR